MTPEDCDEMGGDCSGHDYPRRHYLVKDEEGGHVMCAVCFRVWDLTTAELVREAE